MKRKKLLKKPKTVSVLDLVLHKMRLDVREYIGKQVIDSILEQAIDYTLPLKKPRFIK